MNSYFNCLELDIESLIHKLDIIHIFENYGVIGDSLGRVPGAEIKKKVGDNPDLKVPLRGRES